MRFRYQVVVALGLLALLLFFFLGKSDPVVVSVAAVEPGVVESTVSNTRAGTVKACLRAHLSPSIGGQIAVLNVREGDEVDRVLRGVVIHEVVGVVIHEVGEADLSVGQFRHL